MNPLDPGRNLPARRRVLGAMASFAGATALGIGAPAAPAQIGSAESGQNSEELFAPARLRDYRARRSSSWDRTGGNDDAVRVDPGKEAILLDLTGPGVVTHLWFTINSSDPMHLKNLVLRAWWEGEASPSIESPMGDFFGLGLGDYYTWQSALVAVAPMKALNAYFKMPFASSARLSVTNEGTIPTENLYFAVDYVTLPQLPDGLGRFHAQYRQAAPCKGWTDNWTNEYAPTINGKKNLNGEGNYVFLEATGRGHFLGVTHSVLQNQDQWFGEGDDMIFIDGDTTPTINGTGTEDYYNGAWDFGGNAFADMHQGAPYIVDPERIGGRYCLFRWHTESPITFEKSIRVTIEHGHANHRADNFYSTAFWYQAEPHAAFPVLPKPEARVPRVFRVGGAGAAPVTD